MVQNRRQWIVTTSKWSICNLHHQYIATAGGTILKTWSESMCRRRICTNDMGLRRCCRTLIFFFFFCLCGWKPQRGTTPTIVMVQAQGRPLMWWGLLCDWLKIQGGPNKRRKIARSVLRSQVWRRPSTCCPLWPHARRRGTSSKWQRACRSQGKSHEGRELWWISALGGPWVIAYFL